MKKAQPQRVRIDAPRDMHRLDIAQALVGDKVLLKAEPKFRGKTFRRHKTMRDLNERVVSAYDATLQKMLREMRAYITKVIAPGAKLKKSDWMYGFASDVVWPEQTAPEPLAAPMRPRAPLAPLGDNPRRHPQPLEGERPKPSGALAEGTAAKPRARLHEPTAESSMYGFVSDVEWPGDHDLSEKIKEDESESPFLGGAAWQRAMSIITPEQLERLKQIIKDYHWAFAAQTLGPDVLPSGEVQRLIDAGVLPPDLAYVFHPAPGELPPTAMRFTDTAYAYGAYLGDAKQRGAVLKMGLTDFATHAADAPRPTSAVEKQAMSWARHNAGQYIRGLGDRISLEVGTLVMNEDATQRRKYLGIVREELEASIDQRKTWRQLASEIGHKTGDWSGGLQRIAATEKQWAMQEGTAREIAKGREPDDVMVAKLPNPDACPDCIRLHLKGGQPRIFKMSELQANGTNVGKKRASWGVTVGPVHPWCGCELFEVPEGWGFDDENNLVPEILLKKAGLQPAQYEELQKAGETEDMRPHMTHGSFVPIDTVVIRVSDPRMRAVIENVVQEAPPEIFRKNVGVTLITTDTARAQNPLDEHDFAYWTGNEIRVMQTLPIERLPRVIRHEIGHSLNVHLMNTLGGVEAVRKWHGDLWAVSQREGWVSDYANKLPIENAAEVTRMYLFEKPRLMLNHPLQFAFCRRAYKTIFEKQR